MKLGGPSNGKSRKKRSRTVQSLIMDTPTSPINNASLSGDHTLNQGGGTNDPLGNDNSSQLEGANDVLNDVIMNDAEGNNDASGGVLTPGGGSNDVVSIYVPPPHTRRSARTSRSRYRKSSTTTSSLGEAGPSEPNDSNANHHDIQEAVRAFVKRGRGPTSPGSCRPKSGQDPFVVYWVNGAPVGSRAKKFADYCGLEAKVYHRYPLHKRWGNSQKTNARLIFTTAQVEKHYIFLGEEDPENEGEFLPVDQRAAEHFLELVMAHMVRDWRHTVKRDYYTIWEKSNVEMKKAVERGLDPRIPLDEWPALCRYFGSPEKQAEAERNRQNRKSKKSKPICTLGPISLQNAYHKMQKEQGDSYTPAGGFAEAHKVRKTGAYPDKATRDICEQVQELAKDIPITRRTGCSILIPILDQVKEKRHGGFEMGMGRGYTRRFMKGIESSKIIGAPTNREKERDIEMERLRKENAEFKRREAQRQEQNQIDPLTVLATVSQFCTQFGGRFNFPANPQGGSATNSMQRGQSSSGRSQNMNQIDPITLMATMSQFCGQAGGRFNYPFPPDGHVAGSAQSGQSSGNGFDDMLNENNGSF